FDEAVFSAHLDAEAAKLPLGGSLHFPVGLGVQIGRVGVEVGQHAGDGTVDQLLVFDGLDVVVLDRGEDGRELPKLFERQGAAGLFLRDRRNSQADQYAGNDAHADQAETANFTLAAHVFLRARGWMSVCEYDTQWVSRVLVDCRNVVCVRAAIRISGSDGSAQRDPLERVERRASVPQFKV